MSLTSHVPMPTKKPVPNTDDRTFPLTLTLETLQVFMSVQALSKQAGKRLMVWPTYEHLADHHHRSGDVGGPQGRRSVGPSPDPSAAGQAILPGVEGP